MTAATQAVLKDTTAPSSHKRAKIILLFLSFSFNYFLKYFQIIFRVFIDKTLTTAVIDRLIHHCSVIEIKGESYRFKKRD